MKETIKVDYNLDYLIKLIPLFYKERNELFSRLDTGTPGELVHTEDEIKIESSYTQEDYEYIESKLKFFDNFYSYSSLFKRWTIEIETKIINNQIQLLSQNVLSKPTTEQEYVKYLEVIKATQEHGKLIYYEKLIKEINSLLEVYQQGLRKFLYSILAKIKLQLDSNFKYTPDEWKEEYEEYQHKRTTLERKKLGRELGIGNGLFGSALMFPSDLE